MRLKNSSAGHEKEIKANLLKVILAIFAGSLKTAVLFPVMVGRGIASPFKEHGNVGSTSGLTRGPKDYKI